MSQPPTAPQDPYQFDPYRPQGGSDPAQDVPTQSSYAPQGDTTPYGTPAGAYGAAGPGHGAPEQPAPAAWGAAPGDPVPAPYGAPAYGADPQQGYAQPYGADPQQGYAQPYGAPDPQQGYAQPYGPPDPQQGYAQPYGAPPQQPGYGAPYGGYPSYGAPGPSTTNVLAIVGFVLAVLGLLGSWIPGVNFLCAVLGLAGIVLGAVGLTQIKKGKTGKGFSIAAIVLGVLAIVATVLIWVAIITAANNASAEYEQTLSEVQEDSDRAFGEATDDVLANDLEVEFGTFEGTADEYGWVESSMPVTFTNTSDEPLTFDIDVQAVAADGTVVETDWAYTEELAPGESETVEVFTLIDDENLEPMRTATVEITQASAY
jgi:hypothetical protein